MAYVYVLFCLVVNATLVLWLTGFGFGRAEAIENLQEGPRFEGPLERFSARGMRRDVGSAQMQLWIVLVLLLCLVEFAVGTYQLDLDLTFGNETLAELQYRLDVLLGYEEGPPTFLYDEGAPTSRDD